MAINLNEYAQFLRGLAVGVSGCDVTVRVFDVEHVRSDCIHLRIVGYPLAPALAISRYSIENGEAEGAVRAAFAPRTVTLDASMSANFPGFLVNKSIEPEPVHPVVCAIRNSKPAGTLR